MSVIESDGFTVESSEPNPDVVRANLGETASPVAESAGASPVGTDAAQDGDAPPADGAETPAEREARERDERGRYKKGSLQDRINRVTFEREDARRETARLREELEQLRQQTAAPRAEAPALEPVTAPSADGKPRLEDFPDYETWVEAVADWKVERRLNERFVAAQQAAAHQTFAQRAASFAASTPDYGDVIARAASLPLSAAMQEALLASEHGPALAYFLATHPEDAVSLANETARLGAEAAPMVRRLLETTMNASRAAVSGPAAGGHRPTVPPPIKPVGATPVVSDSSPDDLEFGPEYVRRMNERERKARL